MYSPVYREHMKALHNIELKNDQAYNVLMRKLFRRARWVGKSWMSHHDSRLIYYCNSASMLGDVISLIDVDNMDVEDVHDDN